MSDLIALAQAEVAKKNSCCCKSQHGPPDVTVTEAKTLRLTVMSGTLCQCRTQCNQCGEDHPFSFWLEKP
jgi:hypothetical protein